jgi:hypothetical protein
VKPAAPQPQASQPETTQQVRPEKSKSSAKAVKPSEKKPEALPGKSISPKPATVPLTSTDAAKVEPKLDKSKKTPQETAVSPKPPKLQARPEHTEKPQEAPPKGKHEKTKPAKPAKIKKGRPIKPTKLKKQAVKWEPVVDTSPIPDTLQPKPQAMPTEQPIILPTPQPEPLKKQKAPKPPKKIREKAPKTKTTIAKPLPVPLALPHDQAAANTEAKPNIVPPQTQLAPKPKKPAKAPRPKKQSAETAPVKKEKTPKQSLPKQPLKAQQDPPDLPWTPPVDGLSKLLPAKVSKPLENKPVNAKHQKINRKEKVKQQKKVQSQKPAWTLPRAEIVMPASYREKLSQSNPVTQPAQSASPEAEILRKPEALTPQSSKPARTKADRQKKVKSQKPAWTLPRAEIVMPASYREKLSQSNPVTQPAQSASPEAEILRKPEALTPQSSKPARTKADKQKKTKLKAQSNPPQPKKEDEKRTVEPAISAKPTLPDGSSLFNPASSFNTDPQPAEPKQQPFTEPRTIETEANPDKASISLPEKQAEPQGELSKLEQARQLTDAYLELLTQWQQAKGKEGLEPILNKGQEAAVAILKVADALSEQEFNALGKRMPGYLMIRNDILVVGPDPNFFITLATQKGKPVDIAFFKLVSETLNGYWPSTMEQLDNLSGCTRFGTGQLSDLYGGWTKFRQQYPKAYQKAFEDPNLLLIHDIEDQLLNSNSACEGPESVIQELEKFIQAYPRSPLTPSLKKRLEALRQNKADMIFNQGVRHLLKQP